jgi:hypothetical protein
MANRHYSKKACPVGTILVNRIAKSRSRHAAPASAGGGTAAAAVAGGRRP